LLQSGDSNGCPGIAPAHEDGVGEADDRDEMVYVKAPRLLLAALLTAGLLAPATAAAAPAHAKRKAQSVCTNTPGTSP